MTLKIPVSRVITANLTQLPLEFIDGAIDVLRTISLEDALPSAVQFYLGVFEIRNQPHDRRYISLQGSALPCADQKLRFPIEPLDSMAGRRKGFTQILNIISESLTSIGNPPAPWSNLIRSQFEGCPAQGMSYITQSLSSLC